MVNIVGKDIGTNEKMNNNKKKESVENIFFFSPFIFIFIYRRERETFYFGLSFVYEI